MRGGDRKDRIKARETEPSSNRLRKRNRPVDASNPVFRAISVALDPSKVKVTTFGHIVSPHFSRSAIEGALSSLRLCECKIVAV